MEAKITLTKDIAERIERILADLRTRARAESVLLADISGQLIAAQGDLEGFDPTPVAALAAGQLSAITELIRRIGESASQGSFLHEGREKGIYLLGVGGSFVLIVIFTSNTPVGLVRLFARRTAERLEAVTAEFETMVTTSPGPLVDAGFGEALSQELDKALGEW